MSTTAPAAATPTATYTLWQLVLYALRLGSLGFGGPVALVGYMHRDLVEKRRWISESDYKEGLALSQLAPGPLAAQLAIYLGFVHYGLIGATLVGVAFVLPSFLMVVGLGWAYTRFGGLSWMQALFYGVGSAVIGIIAHSAYRLTVKTVGNDRVLWLIYLAAATVTVVTESEQVLLFLGAGVLYWLVKAPPRRLRGAWRASGLFLPLGVAASSAGAESGILWDIFGFFAEAGAFVFGSGLAIVPFLYGGVVKGFGWLTDHQFLDAVAVAMITPGPVVITVGFIGYLAAGMPGATVAALATFLPCFLFTVIPAPYFKKYGRRPEIAAFVNGVTAAATGAIAGAVVVLGRRSIGNPFSDPLPLLLAVAAAAVLWKARKVPEPAIVLAAAAVGLAAYPLMHR